MKSEESRAKKMALVLCSSLQLKKKSVPVVSAISVHINKAFLSANTGFPRGSRVKNLPALQELPWVGKIPWSRKWQPTPVFLPGESHGQRSVASYIVHGVTKSQTQLKRLSMQAHQGPKCLTKGRNPPWLV